jgi:hypothetical protein
MDANIPQMGLTQKGEELNYLSISQLPFLID